VFDTPRTTCLILLQPKSGVQGEDGERTKDRSPGREGAGLTCNGNSARRAREWEIYVWSQTGCVVLTQLRLEIEMRKALERG
jgi:hypothetical protein